MHFANWSMLVTKIGTLSPCKDIDDLKDPTVLIMFSDRHCLLRNASGASLSLFLQLVSLLSPGYG